jgi:hypothetical protein
LFLSASAAAQAMRTDQKMDILIEMTRQQQAQQTETNKNIRKKRVEVN